jgi:hypothetical protein
MLRAHREQHESRAAYRPPPQSLQRIVLLLLLSQLHPPPPPPPISTSLSLQIREEERLLCARESRGLCFGSASYRLRIGKEKRLLGALEQPVLRVETLPHTHTF